MKGSIICILIPNYSLGKQKGLYIILFKRSRRVKLDNVFFNKKNVIFPKKTKHVSLFDGTAKLWVFSSIFILLMYCRNSRF